MAGLRSLATVLCQNKTINVSFDAYRALGNDPGSRCRSSSVSPLFMSMLMGCTVLGRHLFALGGNEMAAQALERPADPAAQGDRVRALRDPVGAGRHPVHRLERPGRQPLGTTYELTAITAAVVGGCSLSGGVGSIRGTVLGLLLTQIVIKGTGIVATRHRQHPDRGPRAGHGRAPGRGVQPAIPRRTSLSRFVSETAGQRRSR